MTSHDLPTFRNWVELPENRAARLAAGRVAEAVAAGKAQRALNPLLLHGPSGTGKSHLVTALIDEAIRQAPDRVVCLLPAGELPDPTGEGDPLAEARRADLLVVEDLQHLPARAAEAFVRLVDHGLARGQQQVFTACAGPGQLNHLPARLTSRLAGGLVVGLSALAPQSRQVYLAELSRRRGLAVDGSVLDWLAGHLGGSGRVLDGALARLQTLARLEGRPPAAGDLADYFRDEAEAGRPTVERIAQGVGQYFRVEPRHLQSRSRLRSALLPRQVGMYLARQLTDLSLEQIGAYFGGRDHSTVLHACRKVEQALAEDVPLSRAVRQLHADLA
jgi:chromosomal replication initiator protein